MENNFQFVSNDNVTNEYLWIDGIHLSNEGTSAFADIFVDYWNSFILSESLWLSNSEPSLKPTCSWKQFSEDSKTETLTNFFLWSKKY